MAVVLRMARHGSKKRPFYRVVAADKRNARNGRYLEILGTYNPKDPDAKGDLKKDRVEYWLSQGAQPSAVVKGVIKRSLGAE